MSPQEQSVRADLALAAASVARAAGAATQRNVVAGQVVAWLDGCAERSGLTFLEVVERERPLARLRAAGFRARTARRHGVAPALALARALEHYHTVILTPSRLADAVVTVWGAE